MNAFEIMKKAARENRVPAKNKSPPPKRQKVEIVEEVNVSKEAREEISNILNIKYEDYTSHDEFLNYFKETIAPYLLNKVELVIAGRRHQLLEIEFYFTSKNHADPFTHCTTIQENNCQWYFHRTGESYRSGNYKGIDITIGRGAGSPGGILLRSLRQIGTSKVVCGPSKTVDHILELNNYPQKIDEFVKEGLKNDISIFGSSGNANKLILVPAQEPTDETIYFTPRVGLHLTKRGVSKQLQIEFVYRDFRAVIQLPSVWKARHLIVISLYYQGMSAPKISTISGTPLDAVNKFIAHYKTGYAQADITDYFYRRLSDPEVCACYASIKAIEEAEESKRLEKEAKAKEEAEKSAEIGVDSQNENEIDLQAIQEIEEREIEKRKEKTNDKIENEGIKQEDTETQATEKAEGPLGEEEDDYEEFTDEE